MKAEQMTLGAEFLMECWEQNFTEVGLRNNNNKRKEDGYYRQSQWYVRASSYELIGSFGASLPTPCPMNSNLTALNHL